MRKLQRLSSMRGIPSRSGSMSSDTPYANELRADTYHLRRKVIGSTSAVGIIEDEFQGPFVAPIEEPREDNPSRIAGLPVYLGPDGTFYDIDYNRIKDGPKDGERLSAGSGLTDEMKDVYDVSVIEAHQPSGTKALGDLYRSFPDPNECISYEDLETRLGNWYDEMERSLGYVVVPRVMGRCYSRPKVSTHRADEGDSTAAATGAATGAPAAAGDASAQLHLLSDDPWEATLIPPEPDPHFYEDFDQYELAMKRWYNECCKGDHRLRRMLPHPSQLKNMQSLKIQPAKEVFSIARNLGADDAAAKAADSFAFVGVVPGYKNPYVRDRTAPAALAAARTLPDPPAFPSKAAIEAAQGYRKELERAEAEAAGASADAAAAAQENPEYAPQAEEAAAIAAAASAAVAEAATAADEFDAALDRLLAAAEQNSGEYGVTNRPIAAVQMNEKYDTHVDVKRMEETVANPFTSTYPQEERGEYEKLQNAWKARERALLTTDTDETQSLFFEYLRAEAAGPTRAIQAIKAPISFKMFGRLMETKIGGGSTAYASLSASITPELFPELLAQWDLVRDPAVLEKLAFFVCEIVKRDPERAAGVLQAAPCHEACKALYTIARCAYFAAPAQPDIYPFAEETVRLVEERATAEANDLKMSQPEVCITAILNVFQWYYLGLINSALKQESVGAALRASEAALVSALRETPRIISVLFRCLIHRSITISGLSLFVITRLLHSDNRELATIIEDPSANFHEELQLLCFSKLSHVQFAIRRINDILLSTTRRDSLFAHFGMGNRLLLPFAAVGGQCAEDCGVTQTYAEFVERIYGMCYIVAQDPTVAARQTWAFGTDVFYALCEGISECIRVGLYYGAAALARVLDQLCITSFKLKVIATESARSGSSLALTITQDDIDKLVGFINTLTKKNDMAAYPVCAPILSAARILLRNQNVYDEHRGKEKLIQNILAFCKDGKDSDFNRQAWKLFYEIIEYHAGAIELMESFSLLGQFTDVLGTAVNGTTVTIHSIRYFRKVLELGSSEQTKRPVRRDDKKSIEKDVKFFTNFFKEKHLFVKFHMTYKNQASMCGAVFYEVAQVYQKLQVLPETQKLLKDILKNPDYRKGLQDIHDMFPPN